MKVLMIDDHPLFREGVALLLRPLLGTSEIWEAGSCEDAFALLARLGCPDLILVDLALPGMSGLEGIAPLRDKCPDTPLVALSSSDDRETVLKALDAGAMGFIPKSSTTAVLAGALRLVLARGIYLPPVVLPTSHPALQSTPLSPVGKAHAEAAGMHPSKLGLTERQSDVLYQILQGKPAKTIARDLGLASSTVKAHTSAVLRALNVTTRTQAVIAASRLGLRFDRR